MIWVWVIALSLAVFALLAFVLKVERKGWEAIGAALALGLAGFAFQATPSQPGAPKAAVADRNGGGAALVEERQALARLASQKSAQPDRWLLTPDAMTRNGDYADSASLLRKVVEDNPGNAEAWVALGNNLALHADGTPTPAALYAYRQAAVADPASPLPGYFLGLALIRSGQPAEGRALWVDTYSRAPADAAWRPGLGAMVQKLDEMMKEQAGPRP
ncbi:MAG TPA: cytochrome C biosynthesis protein [Novosphingobium sp.]|nr:cytochrome C biosynthesis protein [Novosphingobium sp.]